MAARQFSPEEQKRSDFYFAYLEGRALATGLEPRGNGIDTLSVGSIALRTNRGDLATFAGFPEEGQIDETFLNELANLPEPTSYVHKGIHLARHASGLLVANTNFKIDSDTGDVFYDYRLYTLRTTEATEETIYARAAAEFTLHDGLRKIGPDDYGEEYCQSELFFNTRLSGPTFRETVEDVVRANLQ